MLDAMSELKTKCSLSSSDQWWCGGADHPRCQSCRGDKNCNKKAYDFLVYFPIKEKQNTAEPLLILSFYQTINNSHVYYVMLGKRGEDRHFKIPLRVSQDHATPLLQFIIYVGVS
jgi:hypothetical protein